MGAGVICHALMGFYIGRAESEVRQMGDDSELEAIAGPLRSGHDMLPFMISLHPAAEMQFRPLPGEMQALLEASPDYRPLGPGQGPAWLQIASGDDAAELVVYRARGSGTLYVMAPDPHR